MPIPSGFDHLNRASEVYATFEVPVGWNDTIKVKAASRADAERIVRSDPRPTNKEGGEK